MQANVNKHEVSKIFPNEGFQEKSKQGKDNLKQSLINRPINFLWSIANKIIIAIGGTLTAGIALVVFIQVIARLFRNPFSWAEELAQYFLITSVFIGSSVVEEKDRHVRVESIVSLFSKNTQLITRMVSKGLLIIILCLVLFGESILWPYVSELKSPAGRIPMSMVHLLMSVGILWWLVNTIKSIIRIWKDKVSLNDKKKEG
jgi:TRAP-type C4-dicarboxylate transport system permease small subunit